jgi:hypothetical protein
MNNQNIDSLYYSPQNLDNVYRQVCDEISRRTNKDISLNQTYRKSFNQMAKMVLDKVPSNNRNLANVNTKLEQSSVTFFHKKIFEKTVNTDGPTKNTTGFTMAPENTDISSKYNSLLEDRKNINLGTGAGIVGDGNPNTYLPQPKLPANTFVQNEQFVQGARRDEPYTQQFQRAVDTMQSKQDGEFNIKPFNISDDLSDALMANENEDSPLYQNLANLQAMQDADPMSLLNDYQKQRNSQIENYATIENRQNITAMRTIGVNQPNVMFSRNNTNAQTKIDQVAIDPMELLRTNDKLTQNYVQRMEERIVNDNQVQTIEPDIVEQQQRDLQKLQRDTQPKYIEKVHYININSVDRDWDHHAENRFQFQVKFNQNNTFAGAGISQLYKNIISVELVNAILPFDESINPFDTRLYFGITKYPYLLLRIDELDSVFRGTNNYADRAFSTLLYDKTFFTNVLSTEYITGTSSIVNSTPKQNFASEYMRGYHKYNPAYFEKKKYYNNPLASLSKMSILITDPRGQYINNQNDVLNINTIIYTAALNTLTGLELNVTNSYPNDAGGATRKMISIATDTYFTNRLFRIGDRVIIRGFAMDNSAVNNGAFVNYITRPEGHFIINLDVENDSVGGNQGFLNNIYISPPGVMDSDNYTLNSSTYFDDTTVNVVSGITTPGVLINADLQTQLLFRIVTRDADAALILNSINV